MAVDVTSAETAVMVESAPPRSAPLTSQPSLLSSSSVVDEGRFLPGVVVAGRYRIAGLLGRGGMGEVYRATDLSLGQAVALKFLPEAASRDDRAIARFYNEVRMARQVTHPNVCRVYDIGQVEGSHYISMEFVDGEDLGSLLRRIGRLPQDKAVETARQMCAGLAAAHEKGVLHRDLKPANVMIDGRGQAVIMDFGLAGLGQDVAGDVRSGTPAYMAPEQLAGTEVTFKSDIYSLGLVLYELFTGKRAFEAASLVELIQMQEVGAPPTASTSVKDVDPAVERVIQRCLAHDPKLRPSSALAVSAALPGGDMLAAAMAAGETLSPELLAAAGRTDGLAPKLATMWLVAALILIVGGAAANSYYSIQRKLPLDLPPESLARDARHMLESFGYTARPHDSDWSLDDDSGYIDYLREHPQQAAARWRNPAQGLPPVIHFWYRESPLDLMAIVKFDMGVGYDDPPQDISGMLRLMTDTEGHLRRFEAVPQQVEPPSSAAATYDWSILFRAAGLDMTRFQAAPPEWTPRANWDTRAAWTGPDTAGGPPVRVEASAWRGKPVSFRIVGPWTKPERTQAPPSREGALVLVVIYAVLIAGVVMAWRNHKGGRGDRRGAFRLVAIYWLTTLVSLLLAAHHAASAAEIDQFWRAVSVAGINAVLLGVLYMALEPWVRRRWPHTLIAWSRFTTKGIGDPLVGRDLLYGAAIGAAWCVGVICEYALHGPAATPLIPDFYALGGLRHSLASQLGAFDGAIFDALFFFFLLFLIRVAVRKEWIALPLFTGLATVLFSHGQLVWTDWMMNAVFCAGIALILLRFGMVALIVADAVHSILINACLTPDPSSWCFPLGAVPLVIAVIAAVYGFRSSLAGRPIFEDAH